MKLLKEADELDINQNIDYAEEFKHTLNSFDLIKLFKNFFKSVNFKGYNEQEWNKFVDNTFDILTVECQTYGLSVENPFFHFLSEYAVKNKNLQPFTNEDSKYRLLHNLVSERFIETKQLSFKCPEDEQIRILLNQNLWNLSNLQDIAYLIKLYVWFIDTDLNNYVINSWIKAGFNFNHSVVKTVINPKTKKKEKKVIDKVNVNFKDLKTKIALIKCCMFTNYIEELDNQKKVKNSDPEIPLKEFNDKLNKITENNMLVSGKFMPINTIYHQIYLLREGVQESKRDVEGRYQQTDVDNKNKKSDSSDELIMRNKKRQDNLTRSQKIYLDSVKSQLFDDIKKVINNQLGTNYSDEQIADIMTYYSDNM